MLAPEDFFRQATLRLLSGKPIEKAWQDCLLYVRRFIPADFLSLHLFDYGLSVVETVVDASREKSEAVSHKTTLDGKARETMQKAVANRQKPAFQIMNNLSEQAVSRQLGMDLGTPDDPCLAMDLIEDGRYLGIAALTNTHGEKYGREHGELFLSLHPPLAATASRFHRCRELERVGEMLSDRAEFLHRELLESVEDEIVGAGFGLKGVMDLVERVADTKAPVLLLGETGVGKEVIAGAVHRFSPRHAGPFIKVNCGSIPSTLLESELFGHEKGAFTGAVSSRPGYFERADGGTIFLDEVAELTPAAQVRLLRVLQDSEVERVGGKRTLKLDLRIIAATHRDLESMVRQGSFREDLFFRLNVFPIGIPPLRERKEDIPALAYHFVAKKARELALMKLPRVAPGELEAMMAYHWPGNVRELENVIERQLIIAKDGPITLGRALTPAPAEDFCDTRPVELELDKVVAGHIIRVMRMAKGRVEGEGGAAELLGVNPRTLQSRMKKLGIPFGRKAKGMY